MIQKRHYYYLNAFRLLAALIVLTAHARCEIFATYSMLEAESRNMMTKMLFAVFSFTPLAMTIFFILSGFLVGGSAIEKLAGYLTAKAETKTFNINAYNFLVNRAIRISPPIRRHSAGDRS